MSEQWKTVVKDIPSSFCTHCGSYLIISDNGDIRCDVCGNTMPAERLFF